MHIIEPHTLRSKRRRRVHGGPAALTLLVVIGLVGGFAYSQKGHHLFYIGMVPSTAARDAHDVAGLSTDKAFPIFSGRQFQALYNTIAYPNTQPLTTPPAITGNDVADARIRQIAESRGYSLHPVPVRAIQKINLGVSSGNLLQLRAYDGWQTLKTQASQAGIPLHLNSGYRSVDLQRQYFLARLRALGVQLPTIVSGQADAAIVMALHYTAPPGYSRHHTGYTVDLGCGKDTVDFKQTVCFTWLSKNNYLNAKRAGWIPSYPDGLGQAGPEPEPWEYVWVGVPTIENAVLN